MFNCFLLPSLSFPALCAAQGVVTVQTGRRQRCLTDLTTARRSYAAYFKLSGVERGERIAVERFAMSALRLSRRRHLSSAQQLHLLSSLKHHTSRELSTVATGQPTPESHPHLLKPDELTPGFHADEYRRRRRYVHSQTCLPFTELSWFLSNGV